MRHSVCCDVYRPSSVDLIECAWNQPYTYEERDPTDNPNMVWLDSSDPKNGKCSLDVSKCFFYLAANAVFGKIGRTVSEV